MRNSGRNSEPDFNFPPSDQPALDELAHTDLLLDALADRENIRLGDPDDDALAALLGEWRDDVRYPPATTLVSKDQAIEALEEGLTERRRTRRGLAAVGSVAATLLALSGFGAVVADARPGDALYGLHAMLFSEPRVNDDQIELSAKADLAKVEELIAQGQWDQAHNQLAEVSSSLQGVNDDSRKQNLLNEVNQLNTRVDKRDTHALAPQTGPGPLASPPMAPAPVSTPTSTPPDGATLSTTPSPSKPPAATTTPSTTQSTGPSSAATTPETSPNSTEPAPTTTSKSKHRSRHSSITPTAPSDAPTP